MDFLSNNFSTPIPFPTPIHLIVAIGEDGAIGKNGDLIWKISDDLKNFKKLTSDHPVIMGRKTWESLPKKPLPKRRNIIVTRNKDYMAEGAEVVHSVEEAMKLTADEEPFVIGGAEIYKAFMPYVTHFHLTKVFDSCTNADTFLSLPLDIKLISSSPVFSSDPSSSPAFQFLTFERI